MKKVLLTLATIAMSVSLFSCSKPVEMTDAQTTEKVKDLVNKLVKTDDGRKIISVYWDENKLKNTLDDIIVKYVEKDGKIYKVTIDHEKGELVKEPEFTDYTASWDLIEQSMDISKISNDTIAKYTNIVIDQLPEGYNFKSIGNIEVSQEVTKNFKNSTRPQIKYPTGLDYRIIIRITKGSGRSRSGRRVTTTYYEIKCTVSHDGEVNIEEY